jgi:REP element-mobilizing transposase RayT/CheY-like chemotaxis protein
MTSKNVLIATPHSDLGEILNQSLSHESGLDVRVASTESETMGLIRKGKNLDYALLDLELGVEKVLEFGFSLRKKCPQIELVLISRKVPPVEMEELRPWKLLRKPFVQSELVSLFQKQGESTAEGPTVIDLNFRPAEEAAIPNWLADEAQVTRTLVSAVSKLDAQEAILFSDEAILAHTKNLIPSAIGECSDLVRKVWKGKDTPEILKHVHLESTKQDHLLHVCVVAVGIILAMLYDAETSYRIVRSQTRYLSSVLKDPLLTLPEIHSLPDMVEPRPQAYPNDLTLMRAAAASQAWSNREPFASPMEELGSRSAHTWYYPAEPERSGEAGGHELQPQQHSARSDQSGDVKLNLSGEVSSQDSFFKDDEVHPWPTGSDRRNPFFVVEKGNLETVLPARDPGKISRYVSFSTNPKLFNVYYACLLVPRIRTHVLEGELADYLKEKFPDIFLANGWRLESLQINPGYLEWLVAISPTISPDAHIRVVRRQSSQAILGSFAWLNRDDLLSDFWAPGYLLGSGQHLLPAEEITEYIRMNRQQHYPQNAALRMPVQPYQASQG